MKANFYIWRCGVVMHPGKTINLIIGYKIEQYETTTNNARPTVSNHIRHGIHTKQLEVEHHNTTLQKRSKIKSKNYY